MVAALLTDVPVLRYGCRITSYIFNFKSECCNSFKVSAAVCCEADKKRNSTSVCFLRVSFTL